MLGALSSGITLPATVSESVGGRRTGEVVVPALELLEVQVVDETLLPQVGKEMEVWAAPLERLAEQGVGARNVFHPCVTRGPAVVPRALQVA